MQGSKMLVMLRIGDCSPQNALYARMAKLADAADSKSVARESVRVQVPLWAPKVLYTDLLFQLPLIIGMHGITPQWEFILYEPWLSMWLAAKDLIKINEGEEKERVHTIVGCLFRQLQSISSLRGLSLRKWNCTIGLSKLFRSKYRKTR